MPNSYSPIDESSFTDTAFDAEAMLNDTPHQRQADNRHYQQTQNPVYADTNAYTQPEYAPSNQQPSAAVPNRPGENNATTATHSAAPRQATRPSARKNPGVAKSIGLIKDSRSVMFLGLIFIVLAGYALIVTISYFAHIGSDQSAMLNSDYDPQMINNAGGPFGAWMAHTLLYNWLGIGSFILIYYLGACGLSMLKVYKPSFWSLTLRCLLTAIALSVICGLVTYEFASPIYWGGRHGHLLNERLIVISGIWGAIGVSIVMAGMVIFLYFTELKRVYGIASAGINAYRARQAERRAERERIRMEEEAEAQRIAAEEAERKRLADEEAARIRMEEQKQMEAIEAERKRLATEAFEPQNDSATNTAVQKPENTAANKTISTVISTTIEPEIAPLFTDTDDDDTAIANERVDEKDTDISVEPNDVKTGCDALEEDEIYEDESPLFASDEDEIDDKPSIEAQDDNTFNTSIENESISEAVSDNETTLFVKESHLAAEIHQANAMTSAATAVLSSEPYDPRADLSNFKFPSVELLHPATHSGVSVDAQEMEDNKKRITETLNHYGIPISHIEATVGPTVTLYEIIPAEGVRIAKIKRLEDDIALSLAALGIRIIAPIPGKGTIGIEVPNKDPQVVSMRSIIESDTYAGSRMELPMAMGRTISNEVFMADLCKMPHLLVAGATGMGKSVGLNAIITSLLYKKHPSELKFVLIDPKMVEFSLYARLEKHYLAKLPDEEEAIITDPSKVVATLNSLCVEMDNRYALLKEASMRNIKEYNDKFIHRQLNPEKGHRYLPYIVVIVDEFADLIMTAGKEVETPIARIAQKARAVGIHMILATQRPSTNVITGVIKANFPGRIAFRVFQMVDSRTIIDRPGANQLIGRGDMLFSNNGKLDRVQCAFIDTPEVSAICDTINAQTGYAQAYELPEYIAESADGSKLASLGDRDPLFEECARLVVTTDTASTSSLQRRYAIGYNRAGKIMDQMEAAGIVGPSQGGKPRQVLIDPLTLERILENN